MSNHSEELKDKLPNTTVVLTSLVAGAIAGALAKTTIAPLDRTKINFQITNKRYSTKAAFKFLIKSYQEHGLLSLWRGNSATMARIIPYAAVQFTSHEQWKRILQVDSGVTKNEKQRRFLAGSLAGVSSQTLTYPLDLARARMAVTQKQIYHSLLEVFVKIWRHEGILAFYKGFFPTIVGVIPYAGVSFFTYGTLQNWFTSEYGARTAFTNLLCGAVAGMLGQTSSYPLDIVRRRMQTSAITGGCYNSIPGTLVSVFRAEGLHGIYKGLSMNWIKGPIAVGISFATYDHIRDTLSVLRALTDGSSYHSLVQEALQSTSCVWVSLDTAPLEGIVQPFPPHSLTWYTEALAVICPSVSSPLISPHCPLNISLHGDSHQIECPSPTKIQWKCWVCGVVSKPTPLPEGVPEPEHVSLK